jgi:plasmid stabilization system protein ParE
LRKPVRFTPEASRELHDAVDWHDEEREGLGEELLAEIEQRASEIGAAPDTFASAVDASDLPTSIPTIRQAFLKRFRYRIVFFELPNEVRVVAIAHTRREPGYWKHRLTGR